LREGALCHSGMRIPVTHDPKTMPKHFRDAIEEVLLIWASNAEEWRNVLEYLPL
jgi:hypothetical protein